MPINFTKPVTTDNYATGVLQPINDAIKALSQWLDPAVAGTLTSTPTGAYRLNAGELERFDGTSWLDVPINGINLDTGRAIVGAATSFSSRVGSSTFAPNLQVQGLTFNTGSALMAKFGADASAAYCGLSKSRSTTIGAHGILSLNDQIGAVTFGGSDGVKIVEAAHLRVEVDGTPAVDSMPGRLMFRTNGGASPSPSTRLSIGSDGLVEPGVDNTQGLGSASLRWATVYGVSFVGALTGNASTATTLATARTINGISFNGGGNITVADATKLPLAGGTLTGSLTVGAGRAHTTAEAVTVSATPTFNAALSNFFVFGNLTANVTTMTMSNALEGQFLTIRFKQNATGGWTVALPSGASVSGSINLTANATSYLNMTFNATENRWEGAWTQVP